MRELYKIFDYLFEILSFSTFSTRLLFITITSKSIKNLINFYRKKSKIKNILCIFFSQFSLYTYILQSFKICILN